MKDVDGLLQCQTATPEVLAKDAVLPGTPAFL